MSNTEVFDVCIVGSGLAGLTAAHTLRKERPDLRVIVVEANHRWVGGRLRTQADHPALAPIHLGAELIHGTNTSLGKLVRELGWPTRDIFHWAHGDGGPSAKPVAGKIGYYYCGTSKKLIKYDDDCPDFHKLNAELDHIIDNADLPETDKSTVADFLLKRGVTQEMVDMADSGYANSLNCPIYKLSLRETAQLERVMEFEDLEDMDLKIDGSVARVIDHLRFGSKVVLGWPVTKIEYGGAANQPCVLTAEHGDVIRAKQVISTVPLSIYKRRDIQFVPQLPAEKQAVFDKTLFEPACKVFFFFSEAFWPADCLGTICTQTACPEFWFQPRMPRAPEDQDPAFGKEPDTAPFLVTLFATSEACKSLMNLNDNVLLAVALGQLDDMFGTPANPKPATTGIKGWMKYDWGKAKYVYGGYSGPTFGVTMQHRDLMAAPVNNKIFFAGEHTSRSFASMHGAMDSGEDAARALLKTLGAPQLKNKL